MLALASGLAIWFLGSATLARISAVSPSIVTVTAIVLGVGSIVVLIGPGRAGLEAGMGAAMRAELLILALAVGLGAVRARAAVLRRPTA